MKHNKSVYDSHDVARLRFYPESSHGLRTGTGVVLTSADQETEGAVADLRGSESVLSELTAAVVRGYLRAILPGSSPGMTALQYVSGVAQALSSAQPQGLELVIFQPTRLSDMLALEEAVKTLKAVADGPFVTSSPESIRGGAGRDKRYVIRVELRHSEPMVWRRFEVGGSCSFSQLHRFIQASTNWLDYHLYVFSMAGAEGFAAFASPYVEREGPLEPFYKSASANRIGTWFARGQHITYLYDFGDDWTMDIYVEDVLPGQPEAARAVCLGGERNGPPEDVGGIHGFHNMLKLLAAKPSSDSSCDPEADNDPHARAETIVWLESITGQHPYVPAWFNADAVTQRLAKVK